MVDTSFLIGMLFGFIASIVGSLIMWLWIGNYIVKKRIEEGITDLGEGKYDPIIQMAAVKAVNSILNDDELKETVKNYLNGNATKFANWAQERFISYLENKYKEHAGEIGGSDGKLTVKDGIMLFKELFG